MADWRGPLPGDLYRSPEGKIGMVHYVRCPNRREQGRTVNETDTPFVAFWTVLAEEPHPLCWVPLSFLEDHQRIEGAS